MTGYTANIPYAELPEGWYCTATSPCGYGVYVKKVRGDQLSAGKTGFSFQGGWTTTYRVIFNGFMGGWVVDVDRKEGKYMLGAQAFSDPLAAMMAAEVEILSGPSV